MEIYMLKVEWANDGETNGYEELYAKEETAKEKFRKAVQEAKADYDHVDFNDPECGYCISEDEDSLEIYLDGEYLSEHSTVSLEKMNVITD